MAGRLHSKIPLLLSVFLITYVKSTNGTCKAPGHHHQLPAFQAIGGPAGMTFSLLQDTSLGLFFVEAFLGNPPVTQFLIVDTASRWVVVPCYDNRREQRYNPLKSRTAKGPSDDQASNETKENYRDGSHWSGYFIEEDIGFMEVKGNFSAKMVQIMVACQTQASKQFQHSAALGILGLESSPYSFSTMLKAYGFIAQNSFSVCFGEKGGLLTFGGSSLSERHTSRMNFASLILKPQTGFYTLRVESVWLGNACLSSNTVNPAILDRVNSGFGAVIDSGSSDTYFPKDMEPLFNLAWRSATKQNRSLDSLGVVSQPDFFEFPSIHIILNGNIELTMSSYQYTRGFERFQMPEVEGERRRAMLSNRIHFEETNGAILGLNAYVNRVILFDVEKQRVGIAPAYCD